MSLERTGEVLAHDKQKEVEAVARKMTSLDPDARGDWLFTLPFAGTGMSNPRISLGEIYNFAVSIMALDPAPGDWILDLGSGSCWVSEWLSRMLIHTVSVDISPDMLRIGQQRLGPGARLAAGDFEALPFASGSFDGAVCISALHHVPDIPRTLSEIRRVLKDTGRAVFSEPGRGHASSPQSQAEMQELGVLERDVVAAELLDECLRAGFQTAQVHPYLFPLPAHSPEEWRAMQASGEPRLRSDKRGAGPGVNPQAPGPDQRRRKWVQRLLAPLRAPGGFRPQQREPMERFLVGQDARLAWQCLVGVRNAIEAHPVVVAGKEERRPDSRRPARLRAAITVLDAPRQVDAGERFAIRVRVRNDGDTLWLARQTPWGGFVALGAKLVDTNNLLVVHDYGRSLLGQDVEPGENIEAEIGLVAPTQAGEYRVKLDMVDECIAWFEHMGSPPVLRPLTVTRVE